MAQFKGSIFISTRMFVEERFGAENAARVLDALTPKERELLSSVTSVGWYPVEPILAYHHAFDRILGTGDLALCVEGGRFSAGWALNTILKMFVRLRSPHWLTEKSASVWNRYHDTGVWDYDPPRDRHICGRLRNFEVRDEAFCARLRGWLMGAIELTGGKNPQVLERCCVLRGHGHHEFHCTWE